jgi:hypothetical protein
MMDSFDHIISKPLEAIVDETSEHSEQEKNADEPEPQAAEKNDGFIDKLVEEYECGICYELLHQPV